MIENKERLLSLGKSESAAGDFLCVHCRLQTGCSISCLRQASDWPAIQCCWANTTTCCAGMKLQGVFLRRLGCFLMKVNGRTFPLYCCLFGWEELCPICLFESTGSKTLEIMLIKDGRGKLLFVRVIKPPVRTCLEASAGRRAASNVCQFLFSQSLCAPL